jgi:outer membrane protein TolC
MKFKILIGISIPVLLFSQNLDELVSLALQNKNVEASKLEMKSIVNEYQGIQQGYLPSVTIGGKYTNASNEMSSVAKHAMKAYVDVSYTLYDGGKKGLTYSAYESQIKGYKEDISTLKNIITLSVIEHYFNYYTYLSKREAKEKEIEQLQAQYNRLNRFLDAGTTTLDELDKIISWKESANVEIHELDLNIQTVFHELYYLTGEKVTIDGNSYIDDIEQEVEIRNNLKSLEYAMQTKLSNAKAIKSYIKPQVTIDNIYTYYDNYYDNSSYDTGLENQNLLSLSVTWNIFDFDSKNKAYEAAYTSYLSLQASYEYEKNKANEDLALSMKSYEISKLKIKSAKAALKAANSTYEVSKQKYENGLIENVSYLDALSEKFDAQSSLAASEYALEVQKAYVIYQKGKNLWKYVK